MQICAVLQIGKTIWEIKTVQSAVEALCTGLACKMSCHLVTLAQCLNVVVLSMGYLVLPVSPMHFDASCISARKDGARWRKQEF